MLVPAAARGSERVCPIAQSCVVRQRRANWAKVLSFQKWFVPPIFRALAEKLFLRRSTGTIHIPYLYLAGSI